MSIRTDLVLEQRELHTEQLSGVESCDTVIGDVKINRVTIKDAEAAEALQKPEGTYITIEFEKLENIVDFSEIKQAIVESLGILLPEKRDSVLAVGLGNTEITPDALGPLTVNRLLATRHISKELADSIGLTGLKSVSAIAPGVLGKTGIEAVEIVRGTVERTKPSALIVIDALAARRPSRLCNTIQLSNTGISPGSGVGNSREELSEKVIGVPVIAMGVPTVVDISTYCLDAAGKEPDSAEENMIVTPKEVDMLIDRASEMISQAINIFLQPNIEEEILLSLV